MARPMKKAIPEMLMIPRLKSKKLAEIPHSEFESKAMGALKATPKTNAMVRLGVKKEATIPMASMLSPTNQ